MIHSSAEEVFIPGHPKIEITLDQDAWLVGFAPAVVDVHGRSLPGLLLHHAMLLNRGPGAYREDKPVLPMSGAGSDIASFELPEGYGIPVRAKDILELRCMFDNPFPIDYTGVLFQVAITFQYRRAGVLDPRPSRVVLLGVEEEDQRVGYWVAPGSHARSRLVHFPFAGTVIHMVAHLHAYGQSLVLEDVAQRRTIWITRPTHEVDGQLHSIPQWTSAAGWHVSPETVYRLTVEYDNPTTEPIDAMGILGAFVVPDPPDTALAASESAALK